MTTDNGHVTGTENPFAFSQVLTLINNDRIIMPEQVSLLFEVQDLAVASPATVSRAGMIYNDYKNLGWRPHFDSWLKKFDKRPEFVKEVNWMAARVCAPPIVRGAGFRHGISDPPWRLSLLVRR